MNLVSNKSKYTYTIGCIGRDMVYTLVNTFLLFFLTNGLGIKGTDGVVVGFIMLGARFWDAINDPIMGTIVDNTRTRWGKFKPWIITGALISSVFTYLMFVDFGLRGVPFFIVFTLIYILWDMSFTMNDIPYWSLLPALTTDQGEREKIGSLARIFANVGLFVTTACVPIIYSMSAGKTFYLAAFQIMAVVLCAIFIACQVMVVLGVKQNKTLITVQAEKTSIKKAFKAIAKNDQILIMGLAILLFNVGYFTTTSFGSYFFEYELQNGGLFTVFAIIIGLSQIAALLSFPYIAKRFTRKKLFTISIIAIVFGYGGFMAAGYLGGAATMNIYYLSVIGFFMFAGQAFIQILVLMMLADSIEYGQWKNGTRNESVMFALQPFVNKMGSAIQAPITMLTFYITGIDILNNRFSNINSGNTGDALAAEKSNIITDFLADYPNALLGMRISMIVLPLICILAGYVIYMLFYKIDGKFYKKIISDLEERAKSDGVLIDGVVVKGKTLQSALHTENNVLAEIESESSSEIESEPSSEIESESSSEIESEPSSEIETES